MSEKKKYRTVFMGTPRFAALILERLLGSDLLDLVAVYCRPDKPAGRGKEIKQPEVKILAEQYKLPVMQPATLRKEEDQDVLATWQADFFIVAAYGLILPQKVLDMPKKLPLNIHASLLPKYRGAAPVQRAIMAGDILTGITIMRMEAGLDTGPILAQRASAIGINDTAGDVLDELAFLGADVLLDSLPQLAVKKSNHGIAQDASLASYAAKLSKEESILCLEQNPVCIHAQIRGLSPWPGASITFVRGGKALLVKVYPAVFPLSVDFLERYGSCEAPAGTILGVWSESLVVACSEGAYPFSFVQTPGKQKMSGKAFYHGYVKKDNEARFLSLGKELKSSLP